MAQPVLPAIVAAIAPTTGRTLPPTPRAATAFKSKQQQTPVRSALPPATPVAIAASRLLEAASGTRSLGGVGLMSPRLKPRAAAAAAIRTVSETTTTTMTMTASDATTAATLLSPSLAVISGGGGGGGKGGTRRRGGVVKAVGAAAMSSLILLDAPISSDPIAVGWAQVSAPKVEIAGGENVVPLEKAVVVKGAGGRGSRVSSRAASASKD